MQKSDDILHDLGQNKKETNGILQVRWEQDVKVID